MGKIQVDQGKSKLKVKGLKKIKLCRDGQNIKLGRPNIPDKNCLNSEEFVEKISSAVSSEDRPKLSKKSKKRKKKKMSKSIGDGTELNLACLAYLSEWKNDQESWKFEKVKQIRLTSNMFDMEKVPNKYFDIFLEYMEKASESMKKLITTRASEVIANVEKWNNLSDKDKLTSPKPKNYEGYERARDLLQHFE